MNLAFVGAGIAAVLLAFAARSYLRVRIRQMEAAARAAHDFQTAAVALLERNIPDEIKEQVLKLASVVGTGKLTRKLMRFMVFGKLDTPIRRAQIEARRELWADHSREARIAFTQTVFAGILADSYFAGFLGTLLRRTMFFVSNSPAEIALAIDAMETRILIVGTVDISNGIAPTQGGRGRLARA